MSSSEAATIVQVNSCAVKPAGSFQKSKGVKLSRVVRVVAPEDELSVFGHLMSLATVQQLY